jgi:cyclophilin family peptidyl-prolyl cis-trans isomerase
MAKTPFTRSFLLVLAVLLASCGQQAETTTDAAMPADMVMEAETGSMQHDLVALPGMENEVPALTMKTTISMQTDAGELVIEVYPEAAPNAAARFVELVNNGFYNDTPVSRVVPGFVAQFGINWREGYKDWADNNFADDPTLFSLDRGTLAFAKAGPDTNSTQVFINYIENNRLAAPQYNFTVFGKVVSGMEVVDSFVQVGDPGGGLDQGRLWEDGGNYLDSLLVKPTMILSATVVE